MNAHPSNMKRPRSALTGYLPMLGYVTACSPATVADSSLKRDGTGGDPTSAF